MRILVVQGHPDKESFTHENAIHYYQTAKQLGFKVDLIDLSVDQFDPVLRNGYRQHMDDESYPHHAQELIKAADHIAFFFPVWWSAEPSVLKGWVDRVLTPQFAYRYAPNGKTEKLLQGKSAAVFCSSHGPGWFYRSYGQVIFRWRHLVLGFCGIKLLDGLVLGNMDKPVDTQERRQQYVQRYAQTLQKLR